MRSVSFLIGVCSLSLTIGCSDKSSDRGDDKAGETEPAAPAAEDQPSTEQAPTRSGGEAGDAFEVPRLTVAGGENEGTYTVRSARAACSFGLAGENTWGIQYTAEGDATPRSIQALIPDLPREGGETDSFSFTVGFQRPVNVQTREGFPESGSGTVTVTGGERPVITVAAKTADGAQVDAEIHCNQVTQ